MEMGIIVLITIIIAMGKAIKILIIMLTLILIIRNLGYQNCHSNYEISIIKIGINNGGRRLTLISLRYEIALFLRKKKLLTFKAHKEVKTGELIMRCMGKNLKKGQADLDSRKDSLLLSCIRKGKIKS